MNELLNINPAVSGCGLDIQCQTVKNLIKKSLVLFYIVLFTNTLYKTSLSNIIHLVACEQRQINKLLDYNK